MKYKLAAVITAPWTTVANAVKFASPLRQPANDGTPKLVSLTIGDIFLSSYDPGDIPGAPRFHPSTHEDDNHTHNGEGSNSSGNIAIPPQLKSNAYGNDDGEQIEVHITFDITNDCGFDANAVMNEEGNTIKTGLIAAATTKTIAILNGGGEVNANDVTEAVESSSGRRLSDKLHRNNRHRRHLAHFSQESPVSIQQVIDMTVSCEDGKNCLLIVATIPVSLDEGDDSSDISKLVSDGIKESFGDGSFFAAIPEENLPNCH